MFRSSTIIKELVLSLAKVILKHSVKLCPYRLSGSVTACTGVVWVLCAVQNEAEWRVCCVLCRMRLSGVCVVCCAE
jgi:hypothetical protein